MPRRLEDSVFQRLPFVLAGADAVKNVLDHDDGRIHDDAEIDGTNRQQVRRLAAQKQHAEREHQRQRNVDGHDQRTADIPQKHQQDQRDEHHAFEQISADGFSRHVDQRAAVVVRLDLRSGEQPAGRVIEFVDLVTHRLQRGQRLLPFAKQHDPLHFVVFVDEHSRAVWVDDFPAFAVQQRSRDAHLPLSRLIADDNSPLADRFASTKRPPFDDMLNADRHVVRRVDDDLPNLTNAAFLFAAQVRGGFDGIGHAACDDHRVFAATDQTDAAHDLHVAPLHDVIATDVGVAVGDRLFQLSQRDAVFLQAVWIGTQFVAFDRPPRTDDAGDARYSQQFTFERPVLERFEVAQRVDLSAKRVLRTGQRVAIDFSDG